MRENLFYFGDTDNFSAQCTRRWGPYQYQCDEGSREDVPTGITLKCKPGPRPHDRLGPPFKIFRDIGVGEGMMYQNCLEH